MLEITEIELCKLQPWQDNPRLNDQAVEAVAQSIRSFGFKVPILCNKDLTIIAGHTRWKAAQKLGMTLVPVIVVEMTDSQRRAFSIADNKTAEIADWNFPKLRELLDELRSEDVDLGSLGYSDNELKALLTPEKDFDWDAFDLSRQTCHDATLILLPVKIDIGMRDAARSAIGRLAKEHGVGERDFGIVAGKVFVRLLGLSQ